MTPFVVNAAPLLVFSATLSSDYAHGVTMLSPFTSEKKQLVSFCSPSGDELRKFAEELREAITEVNEMEQIHIQCKDDSKTHKHTHTHWEKNETTKKPKHFALKRLLQPSV